MIHTVGLFGVPRVILHHAVTTLITMRNGHFGNTMGKGENAGNHLPYVRQI